VWLRRLTAACRLGVRRAGFLSRPRRPSTGQWRETGSLNPAPQGQPPGSKLDDHEAFILALVEEEKDIALYEIAEKLAAERGVDSCAATVWYFFSKRGLTHKKRQAMHRNSSARTSSPGGGPGSTARSTSIRSG